MVGSLIFPRWNIFLSLWLNEFNSSILLSSFYSHSFLPFYDFHAEAQGVEIRGMKQRWDEKGVPWEVKENRTFWCWHIFLAVAFRTNLLLRYCWLTTYFLFFLLFCYEDHPSHFWFHGRLYSHTDEHSVLPRTLLSREVRKESTGPNSLIQSDPSFNRYVVGKNSLKIKGLDCFFVLLGFRFLVCSVLGVFSSRFFLVFSI